MLLAAAVLTSTGCGSSGREDGRYLTFDSNATDLVPGDTNDEWDVFVRDQGADVTVRASVTDSGAQSDGESGLPAITPDGHVVAFWSDAANLVEGDTGGHRDLFVRDLAEGRTERVSVGPGGAQGNDDSAGPVAVSEDGRYVAFRSRASNLVEGDANGGWDVFVRDRLEGTTERISLSGTQENGRSDGLAVSADGRFVAFDSPAPNLVAGDLNGGWDVFVRDRVQGTSERISLSGIQDNGRSHGLSLSADGRYVAFQSSASNLVDGDTNGKPDVFLRDRSEGTTERVSLGDERVEGTGPSGFPSLSADGRYVAFESEASNLVAGDMDAETDVFVRDRVEATTELVSVGMSTVRSPRATSDSPALSSNGRYVLFWSGESDQPGWDVFVRDRTRRTTELVSVPMPPAVASLVDVQPTPGSVSTPVTVTVAVTVDGRPASSATVGCSATVLLGTGPVVSDAPLPSSGEGYDDGTAVCRWTLPADSAGKTIHGVVTVTTPNGRVWRRFESSIAGQQSAASLPGLLAGRLLFTRSGADGPPDLYTAASDGSDARLFARNASSAAVSRDGQRILFVRDGAIWQMRRDGSKQRQVTQPSRSEDADPAWSPDGRRLYFSRATTSDYAIFSVDLDGSNLRRLTEGCRGCSGGQFDAAPSPDGRIVAFTHSSHGGGEDSAFITAMTPAGTEARLGFATTSASHESAPAWAPNGKSLAFDVLDADALGGELNEVGLSGIYVSASGSPRARRIARPNRDAWKTLGDPSWSADGRWIAFVQEHAVGYETAGNIWLVRADGGALRRVTAGNADAREPTWLPPAP